MNDEIKNFINGIIESSNPQNDKQVLYLKDQVMNIVLDCFSSKLSPENKPTDFISSDEAIIEFKDEKTNKLYRRFVPLSFIENANGIKLAGEDLHGNPSEIVFLSSIALEKIKDVTGGGLDKSRCHD